MILLKVVTQKKDLNMEEVMLIKKQLEVKIVDKLNLLLRESMQENLIMNLKMKFKQLMKMLMLL